MPAAKPTSTGPSPPSNDCSFVPPGENRTAQVRAAVECSGRVMLLFRDLPQNTRKTRVAWLRTAFHYQLAQLESLASAEW